MSESYGSYDIQGLAKAYGNAFGTEVKVSPMEAMFLNFMGKTALSMNNDGVVTCEPKDSRDPRQIWWVLEIKMMFMLFDRPYELYLFVNRGTEMHLVAQGKNMPVVGAKQFLRDGEGSRWSKIEVPDEKVRGGVIQLRNATWTDCYLDLAAGSSGAGTPVFTYTGPVDKEEVGLNQVWEVIVKADFLNE